jgi:iron complex transport system substrate-binding protein
MLRKSMLMGLVLISGLALSAWCPPVHWAVGRNSPSKALASPEHGHVSKGRRIVSMAPNITETIFALGCGDRLVGVTDFCTYPAEATALPKVGGYYNPNLERLTALRPDLVILQGKHRKVDTFCRTRGIPVLHVAMDSLSSIYRGIGDLGKALQCPERAQSLCSSIRHELESVRRDVASYARQKVFVCLGREPGGMTSLYTAGGPSFITEILQIVGGDNIFEDVTQPYPEASKESLIKRAPDIIIEMRPGENISDLRLRQIMSEWNILRGVPAISNNRIHVLTQDFLLIPGPRVGAACRILGRTLHPEIKDGT